MAQLRILWTPTGKKRTSGALLPALDLLPIRHPRTADVTHACQSYPGIQWMHLGSFTAPLSPETPAVLI